MRRIAYLMIILLGISPLFAQLRNEFKSVKKLFDSGKISEGNAALAKLKANNEDERAFIMYYIGFAKMDSQEALNQYLATANRHSKTYYGQLAMLEAAKIYILERDLSSAQAQLKRIDSAEIVDRFFWTAKLNFERDEYAHAIANSENYLRFAPGGKEAENAYHIIVDTYIAQRKYLSAISTLSRLKKMQNIDLQHYYYKLGYANQMNGNTSEALSAYKKGYEYDKYSQLAYTIEEQLFEMRAKNAAVDISFLYPYEPLEIAIAVEETSTEISEKEEKKEEVPKIVLPPIAKDLPFKLPAKPNKGVYVQAGRFAMEANANGLTKSLRDMQVMASYYEDRLDGKQSWVVVAGPFESKKDAAITKGVLTDNGINSFVIGY